MLLQEYLDEEIYWNGMVERSWIKFNKMQMV